MLSVNPQGCMPELLPTGGVTYRNNERTARTLNHLVESGLSKFQQPSRAKRRAFTTWYTDIQQLEADGRTTQVAGQVSRMWIALLSGIGRFRCPGHLYYDRHREIKKVQKKIFAATAADIAIFSDPRRVEQFRSVVEWMHTPGRLFYTVQIPWNLATVSYRVACVAVTGHAEILIAVGGSWDLLTISQDASYEGLQLTLSGIDKYSVLHTYDPDTLVLYARCYEYLIRIAEAAAK